jgi:8-oxo-dGTP pyrophosphatase MutT (NUDIX family)
MPYTPIVATLGYVLSPDRSKVLLIHRNARPGDHHLGKYNGLGGKVEADEDVLDGMRREIREEAGIECAALQLRGTISWPGFGKHGEDWLGFLFLISAYSGEPFVRIVRERQGSYRLPEPKILAGSNYADVGFALDETTGRVVSICAIDNLMKGAAGTAVQCMNLICGFDERAGLGFPGLHPV